jgi:hypothetical protein
MTLTTDHLSVTSLGSLLIVLLAKQQKSTVIVSPTSDDVQRLLFVSSLSEYTHLE